ncbi:MAG: Na+/H+ antiporter NhaA [bacterium]|nr:Na+/H+ antiporter NhaA [bacterium]
MVTNKKNRLVRMSQIGLKKTQKRIVRFFHTTSAAGTLLIFWVMLALLLANTGLGEWMQNFFQTPIGFHFGEFQMQETLKAWVDDGLMAIFFLLVGLEIKRELLHGELSTPKKAILPVVAAIGGAIVPAGIYLLFNAGTPTHHGWGIPMATDIAFALAIIAMLGNKVPSSLKIFLAALAIVDDLLAILVIAIFYSSALHWEYLAMGGIVLLFLLLLNRAGVKKLWWYLVPGIFLWYFIHHSGIHATIAGVLLAMTIPTKREKNQISPLEFLEHKLHAPVVFGIVPIFAFVNTAIILHPEMAEGLVSRMGLGITLGLLIGKAFGIFGSSWLLCKLKLATLPHHAKWKHILGVGMLGGIGFTMSIFVSMLSFNDPVLIEEAKLSILLTSFVAGVLGYLYLKSLAKKTG